MLLLLVPGNVFLDDDMQVKIGDMGLATKLTNRADKRNTLCGTPNYIAPEVLVKKGHSFEVLFWRYTSFNMNSRWISGAWAV